MSCGTERHFSPLAYRWEINKGKQWNLIKVTLFVPWLLQSQRWICNYTGSLFLLKYQILATRNPQTSFLAFHGKILIWSRMSVDAHDSESCSSGKNGRDCLMLNLLCIGLLWKCFGLHENIQASIFRRRLRLIWFFMLLLLLLLSAARLFPPLQSTRASETGTGSPWQLCLCSDWLVGCRGSSHGERRVQRERGPHLRVLLRDV